MDYQYRLETWQIGKIILPGSCLLWNVLSLPAVAKMLEFEINDHINTIGRQSFSWHRCQGGEKTKGWLLFFTHFFVNFAPVPGFRQCANRWRNGEQTINAWAGFRVLGSFRLVSPVGWFRLEAVDIGIHFIKLKSHSRLRRPSQLNADSPTGRYRKIQAISSKI